MGNYTSSENLTRSNKIEIRFSDNEKRICYTITFTGNGSLNDHSVVKSITTISSSKTKTMSLNPKTRQLTDSEGNCFGEDGDFKVFTEAVQDIITNLSNPWKDIPSEESS